MSTITYFQPNDTRRTVETAVGAYVVQGAQNSMIEGIVDECGGECSCGTFHCYIDERWRTTLPGMSAQEKQTLECSIGVTEASRLSRQLVMTVELDGFIVRLPNAQI